MKLPPNLVKVAIPLEDDRDGLVRETLWATLLKNGNCRLENHPVCSDDFKYHDIVKIEFVENDFPVVTAFVARLLTREPVNESRLKNFGRPNDDQNKPR